MSDTNPPTVPKRAPRGTNKHPQDYTGRQGEKGQTSNEEAVLDAAERMSTAQPIKVRPRRKKAVVDYSADNRPKRERIPTFEVPDGPPKKYQVRVLADIEKMTFGHEWVEHPEFDENGNVTRPGGVGPLLVMDFKEGHEYILDEPVYRHLVKLGYCYDLEEDDEE